MKFVALISGGKDSIYSILECQRYGHELVACVHLGAPSVDEEESYMYQTAASEVLPTLVEECLGVPLVLHRRVGKSVNTSLVYETSDESDEVEDLYEALKTAQERFPSITAVSSGAILSTYQRVRIENVCSRLGLTSLSYLWRNAPQKELLEKMIDDGLHAVLVKVACPPGLIPQKHLNKSLYALHSCGLFQRLHDRYQFHMCGEGGEYETLVLDCPSVFKKRLVLDEVDIVETDDGVGSLIIKKCHAEEKSSDESANCTPVKSNKAQTSILQELEDIESNSRPPASNPCISLPHARRVSGGLFHFSEIVAPIVPCSSSVDGEEETEADLAVKEALSIFQLLERVLSVNNATTQDALFVHVYLSEISHFASINKHYRDFFGTQLPPSRSCIAVGKDVLPGGRRIMMDCMVQCGSGKYLRATETEDDPYATAARYTSTSKLRDVLHVQSISHWAPVCVGPYSQANTLRSGLHFLAGQIGLIPSTMTLHDTWTRQLEQCWINIASVVDALDAGSLDNIISGLVYISDEIYAAENSLHIVESISRQQLLTNAGVVPSAIDSADVTYGGYEDEETWREMTQINSRIKVTQPILIVSIPEMPVGAEVEVEVICATQKAASCLDIHEKSFVIEEKIIKAHFGEMELWDSGHDFPSSQRQADEKIRINIASRSIGNGCAAVSLVTANSMSSNEETSPPTLVDTDQVLDDMLNAWVNSILKDSSGLSMDDVLHIRLYYVASMTSPSENGIAVEAKDDGTRLRCALHSVLASLWCKHWKSRPKHVPACTVVPVQAMTMVQLGSADEVGVIKHDESTLLAMQILAVDAVHMETETWIHHGREDQAYSTR